MTEMEKMRELFRELGVPYEHLKLEEASCFGPKDARHEVDVSQAQFYFNADGAFLGVQGGESADYEPRLKEAQATEELEPTEKEEVSEPVAQLNIDGDIHGQLRVEPGASATILGNVIGR